MRIHRLRLLITKNYAVSETDGDYTLVVSDGFIQSDVILGSSKYKALLFKGIAHSVNAANSLVLKLISSSLSAYFAILSSKLSNPPLFTGSDISLVSVFQVKNNARIMIAGSLDMFNNRFDKSGNEQFVTELSKWDFQFSMKGGI